MRKLLDDRIDGARGSKDYCRHTLKWPLPDISLTKAPDANAEQIAVADRDQLHCFTPTTLQPRRRLGSAFAPEKQI